EHLTEASTPDHVCHLDDPTVVEDWSSVGNAGHPVQHPIHPARLEICALHSQHGSAVEADLLHCVATDGRTPGDHMPTQKQENRPEQASAPVVQPYRQLPGIPPGQDRRVGGSYLVCNVGAGVRRAHHEHWAGLELRRSTVLTGMQLSNRRIEVEGKLRDARRAAEGPGRNDDIVRDKLLSAEPEQILSVARLDLLNMSAGAHWKLESFGVAGEIVRDLVLGRIRPS